MAAQVSDLPKVFSHPLPLSLRPTPLEAREISGGQEARFQHCAPSEGQLFYAAVGGSGGCCGFDLIQAPK